MDDDQTSIWASSVVLGNGDTAFLRPLVPADQPDLLAFHERQSSDSTYRRFFSPKPTLSPSELERFTTVDMVDRVALAVELHDEFIAWASYERWPGRAEAEAAFMVDDEHHGMGIATLLLEHLAAIARSNGIERFTAEVLADNRAMLAVFAKAGWPLQRRFDSGVVDLDWELAQTDEFIDSVERREQRADSRAVARILTPRAIAVIGASDRPGSLGKVMWDHVAQSATVPIHAVNPRLASKNGVLDGHPCVASVADLPDDVSLAIIAIAVRHLSDTIDQCIAKRMRGAVIVTNIDSPPIEHVDIDLNALVARARRNGLRIIGPSSMGITSFSTRGRLQASIVDVDLPAGNVAISLQGGSLGISMLRRARELDLGLSWMISLGSKSDISGNDLLQFWEEDAETQVIGMYTESFGNPKKFARLARRVSLQKPIVAVRSGAAAAGSMASALFLQAGLIEVPTVHALLDTVRVLSTQPVLRGPRIAVISNSQSPSILARDALGTAGLEPRRPDPTFELGWYASSADFATAVEAAMNSADIDGVFVIHAPAVEAESDATGAAVDRAARGRTKPLVAIMLGNADGPIVPGSAVPSFSFPEQAAAALGRSYGYFIWREREAAAPSPPIRHVEPVRAAQVITQQLELLPASGGRADADARQQLLAAYGVTMPPTREVAAAEAAAGASELGFPVAIKAQRRAVGRSVRAGVALDVGDADEVRDVVGQMAESLGDGAAYVIVQPMVPPGVDVRIRCEHDEQSGVVVSIGLGGSTADAVDDRTSRLAPVSPATAVAMLSEARVGQALIDAEIDTSMLADAIVQVAQLASDHPDIGQIDLNPVIVSHETTAVTDAIIELVPHLHPDTPLRRLG